MDGEGSIGGTQRNGRKRAARAMGGSGGSTKKKSTGPAVDVARIYHGLVKAMFLNYKAAHPFLARLDFINMSDDMIEDIFVSKRARKRQLKVLTFPPRHCQRTVGQI